MMLKKIIKTIKNNPRRILLVPIANKYFRWINDKTFLKYAYWCRTNNKLNLDNPQTYNEKLQWIKLYNRDPDNTDRVDKYKVRDYISNVIGEKYLIPLLGVYDAFEDIDFSKLPDQFVLKCTHDSGSVIICKDKHDLNIKKLRKHFNRCMKINHYYKGREWYYKDIEPKIICEKYMVDESNYELKDYKIFCFNGIPKMIKVDYNRFNGHKRSIYDMDWKRLPVSIIYPSDQDVMIEKPSKFDKMVELAKILSKDQLHVRVDFYSIEEKLYFGELTFYHGSGFGKIEPSIYQYLLGEYIILPDNNKVSESIEKY